MPGNRAYEKWPYDNNGEIGSASDGTVLMQV